MNDPDRALVERAQRGDSAALDELLARHEQQVYRFGLRMCGNVEDAREILQETLLSAFRHLPGFRGDAQLSTWLYQIARSFCIKLRRPSGDVRGDEGLDHAAREIPEPGALPDAQVHARQIGEALAAALRILPAEQREVLILRDVEGLSAEEAAKVVGIEVGALKSRLHRARLELRGHLATLLGESGSDTSEPPCPELLSTLSAYVGKEVDQATCIDIERHLAGCARCAGACEALQRTVSLCRRIPGDEVPPAVRLAVRHALQAALTTPTR